MHGMHTQAPRNRLRELRLERNITLREIGETCGGLYTSTVKRWETGLIPQHHLAAVAKALDVSVPYLAGWVEDDEQEAA